MSQPATTFYLGHVPWDSSYRDVRNYASESAQRSGIMGFMNPAFTTSGNTFFRNHARMLRVPFHATSLHEAGVNYIAWQNGSSGKWWYAFVQEIRYLNDDVSNLVIEVDVFQTWWFDLTPKACYVEREHASDDTVGANILDEPVDTGEFVVNETRTTDTLKNYTIIVMSAEEPTGLPTDVIAFKKESKGGWSDTMYEGCGIYAFNLQASSGEDAATWISWLTRAGGGNSISAVFMYPTVLMPANSRYDGTNLFDENVQITPSPNEHIFNWGTDLDGYTPRNNKLHTYPFSFVRASNNNGNYHDYRFELQNTVNIARSDFQIRGALEFELLRRFFHLGGELGDELLLFGGRQLALLARDAVELGLGGILGFLFTDFDEVADAFLYSLRRDPVLAVVCRLNLAAAVSFVDSRTHRRGYAVSVHDYPAVRISRGATYRLYQ